MTSGIIFDVKEFALHDGGGIRTTVFMKGCPLRCIWCHNPEGLRPTRELFVKSVGCLGCGLCRRGCSHEECRGLGRCIHICPMGLIDAVGKKVDCDELAARVMKGKSIFDSTGGGVTISGGEPLLQAEFVRELARRLDTHRLLETSGYADKEVFCETVELFDMIYIDVKLADREEHKKYTGVYNDKILENLRYLQKNSIPHRIRVPLIPDITDTKENLRAIAELAGDSVVELLSYNSLAGAKYSSVGMTFTDKITKTKNADVDTSVFANCIVNK